MDKIEQAREALGQWRYEICCGPEGEENYAFVYDADGALVSNLKTHHAKAVVDAMNAPTTPVDGVGAEPVAWITQGMLDDLRANKAVKYRDLVPTRQRDWNIPVYLANPEAEARLRERVTDTANFDEYMMECARADEAEAALISLRERVAELEKLVAYHRQSNCEAMSRAAKAEARLAQADGGPAVTEAWQPIESAPLDGTTVDLWHEDFGRHTDHYWGVPSHECGEAGSFCDSDWHSISEGWVDGTFNSLSDEPQGFTHWMPHPKPPAALHPQSAAGEEGKP